MTYWPPVYAFLRRSGCDPEKAGELTQAFFAEVVIQRGLFEKADRDRARLRTLLRAAVKRFAIDQHRRGVARGSQVTIPISSFEHAEAALPMHDDLPAECAFDRQWARAVLEEALHRCREHYLDKDRKAIWDAFVEYTVQPILGGSQPPALTSVAERYGYRTPALLASALQGLRRRLMVILTEIVGETVDEPGDAANEMRELIDLLRVH